MATIFLTGACGSLGQVLAQHWDKQGHHLLLSDLDPLALQQLDKRLQGDHTLVPCDLWTAGADAYQALALDCAQDYPHLDGLVHTAVYANHLQTLRYLSPETWLKCLQVNVTAPLWLTQALLPLLQAAPHGKVIFCEHPQLRESQKVYWHGFGASQSALSTMIDEWQAEEASLGVKIERAALPWLDNAMSRRIFPDGQAHWQQPEAMMTAFAPLWAF